MANYDKKTLFRSYSCLFDLKKKAKDILVNLIMYFYNIIS